MATHADWDDYHSLFVNDIPLIDARAPIEFSHGSFPTAVNLPLMLDDERALVGTCYKQYGNKAAIALGHQLVSGEVKEQRINAWKEFIRLHPEGCLFCFRGGLRSQISQLWLAEVGCHYPRIAGGYKAMRHFLVEALASTTANGAMIVLSGQTGCAKTQLLQGLHTSIDLEKLANHRGSAFGKRVGGQPSQIDFENGLAIALLKQRHVNAGLSVVLEDESHLIGRILIPDIVMTAMQNAPLVIIETSLEQRVEHTYQNYILDKLNEWQKVFGEQQGFTLFAEELLQGLSNLKRRLGGWRYQQLNIQMQAAIAEHIKGNSEGHIDWIMTLLKDYYDPMYRYQLSRKTERVVFQGSYLQVREYLLQQEKSTI
ncbi:MAG TPA: tRNA 2-selenouridine(34) synthase MnmH [Arenimonas sp.]|nr:tRNA 2-selenouridine(34) synthase MnmH [Arenimonas sp.]